jgi:putative ABC transport system substrate-binding protein
MAGMLREIESSARSLNFQMHLAPASDPSEIEGAFATLTTGVSRPSPCFPDRCFYAEYPRIVRLASQNRYPAVYAAREGATLGGLMSYGANLPDLARQTAAYVQRILKGAKPADLPVQQPTRFELVINPKTAKKLGLTISRDVLLLADEVID